MSFDVSELRLSWFNRTWKLTARMTTTTSVPSVFVAAIVVAIVEMVVECDQGAKLLVNKATTKIDGNYGST